MTGAPDILSADVVAAFNAHPLITSREATWFARQGVSDRALREPTPIRGGDVTWIGRERFELGQHTPSGSAAERAILTIAMDEEGDPFDLVAWQPRTGQIGTWRGYAWAVGQDRALAPRIGDDLGLRVWRGILQWLQADRDGLVIIRPRIAAELLCDAGPIVAEDVEHGQQLRRLLTRPPPRILVPEPVKEHA